MRVSFLRRIEQTSPKVPDLHLADNYACHKQVSGVVGKRQSRLVRHVCSCRLIRPLQPRSNKLA